MINEFNKIKESFLKLYNKTFESNVDIQNYMNHEHVHIDMYNESQSLFLEFEQLNVKSITFNLQNMNAGLNYLNGTKKL